MYHAALAAAALLTAVMASELVVVLVAMAARRLAAEYALSNRRVRRFAPRPSLSNQGSDGRCRCTNWLSGRTRSSTEISSSVCSAARSSTSSGHSLGRHSRDADNSDRNCSTSRRRQGRHGRSWWEIPRELYRPPSAAESDPRAQRPQL